MTTTYEQIVADVVAATTREDLVATGEIDLAIRRATLKLHSMAFWPRDLAEGVVTFADNTLFSQSIAIAGNLPRFRAIKYIRESKLNELAPTDVLLTQPYQQESVYPYDTDAYFVKMEPDAILDDYGGVRVNIWYLGGTNINLNCRKSIGAVDVGWYQHPIVLATNFNSWLADVYPFAIVDEASRMIFKSTGFMELARAYDDITAEHRQILIQTFTDGEGR